MILNEEIIERLSKDPRYSVDLLNFIDGVESEEGEGEKRYG